MFVLPLIKHDSWFFKTISIHVMKFWLNANFFKTEIKKLWSNKSKVFSTSIVTKKHSVYCTLIISIISDINLLLLSMFLFWTVHILAIVKPLNFFESALDSIFVLTFINVWHLSCTSNVECITYLCPFFLLA